MSTSCSQCGSPLFESERYCPTCGVDAGPNVAVVTPPDLGQVISPRTSVGQPVTDCEKCGYGLAEIERFCPKCGTPKPGVVRRPTRGPWEQLRERVAAATAGRYVIEGELGRGGMAAVYRAHEVALNRAVAIKVLRPDLGTSEEMVRRFLREARTMANLQHPNIVTIYGVESRDDLHYFAMQYIQGRSLDRILAERGALPVAVMQWVVYQAAQGLGFAHEAGVIHRDVKPGNIMVDTRGTAIVTDFGIAKVTEANVTATSTIMGTPLYMSPEQCLAGDIGPSSDQHALGTVAYEMVAGRTPFQGSTPVSLALAITSDVPPPIRSLKPDCPPGIEVALQRILSKRPEGRYPDIRSAAAALGGDHLAPNDPARAVLAQYAVEGASGGDHPELTPRTPVTPTNLADALAVSGRLMPAAVVSVALLAAMVWYVSRADGTRSPSEVLPAEQVEPGPALVPDVPERTATAEDSVSTAAPRLNNPPAPAVRAATKSTDSPLPVTAPPVDTIRAAATRPEVPPAEPTRPIPADTVVRRDPPQAEERVVPKPVDRGPEIRAALDRYEAAINSRNLGQLRTIFPGLGGEQESQWRDLFSNDVEQLRGNLTVRSVKDLGYEAEATFLMTLTFKPRGDQLQTLRIAGTATLKLAGGTWRIMQLQTKAE